MRLDHLLSKGREGKGYRSGDSVDIELVVLILEGLELVSWFELRGLWPV